jgi:hypothetical protein
MNTVITAPFELPLDAIQTQLKIRSGTPDETAFLKIAAEVQSIGQPKALYKVAYIEAKGPDTVTVDGVTFTSPALRQNCAEINRIFPYIATCGREVTTIETAPGDLLAGYWLNVLQMSLLRSAIEQVTVTIEGQYQLKKTATMNPGSGEASVWPIEQQTELFSLFGDVEEQVGVELLPSYLMMPEMSVSGIFFQTESTYVNCQLCQRENCPGRRAEFDCELWEALNTAL